MLTTLRYEPTFELVCQTANPLNRPLQACRPAYGVLAGLFKGFLAALDGLVVYRRFEQLRSYGSPHDAALRHAFGLRHVAAD